MEPKEQIFGKLKWKFKTFVMKENAFKSCVYTEMVAIWLGN